MNLEMNLELKNDYNSSQSERGFVPSEVYFLRWIRTTLDTVNQTNAYQPPVIQEANIGVSIVDLYAMCRLNTTYRSKTGATNVLSFPYRSLKINASKINNSKNQQSDNIVTTISGDIAMCAPIINDEAKTHNITPLIHWCFLSIHATLHVCGYNHIEQADAKCMESLEEMLLKKIGYSHPYRE